MIKLKSTDFLGVFKEYLKYEGLGRFKFVSCANLIAFNGFAKFSSDEFKQ